MVPASPTATNRPLASDIPAEGDVVELDGHSRVLVRRRGPARPRQRPCRTQCRRASRTCAVGAQPTMNIPHAKRQAPGTREDGQSVVVHQNTAFRFTRT